MKVLRFLIALPFLFIIGIWLMVLLAPILAIAGAFLMVMAITAGVVLIVAGGVYSVGYMHYLFTGRWPDWIEVSSSSDIDIDDLLEDRPGHPNEKIIEMRRRYIAALSRKKAANAADGLKSPKGDEVSAAGESASLTHPLSTDPASDSLTHKEDSA